MAFPLTNPLVSTRPHSHLVWRSVLGDTPLSPPFVIRSPEIDVNTTIIDRTAGTHLYPASFICVFGDIAWRSHLHFRCEVFGGVLCGLCFRLDEQCFYCDSFLNNFSNSWKTNTCCASAAISNMKASDCAPGIDSYPILIQKWSRRHLQGNLLTRPPQGISHQSKRWIWPQRLLSAEVKFNKSHKNGD